jgi:uncharacterized protein (TIGR03435 family)
VRRITLSAVIVAVGVVGTIAQETKPTFEVASVRPAPAQTGPFLPSSAPVPPRERSASGLFDATATLRRLISWAYRPQFPIEGSFRELDDLFVIAAKAEGPVRRAGPFEVGPMNQMLQSLLEERFKLRVRWETRSFQVFALRRTTTEQLGANLKRLDVTCPPGYPDNPLAAPEGCALLLIQGRGQVRGAVRNMADFAKFLSMFAGTKVVDDTGLLGPFALTTAFDPRSDTDFGPPPEEHLPSLRNALRYDLGLKLEPERRDLPVLIVEHVEQPTEN